MRVRSKNCRITLGQRPFAGGLGASLYIGTDGQESIKYRRWKVAGHYVSPWWCVSTDEIDPGAASIPTCAAVGQVKSPTTEIDYAVPAELLGTDVWCQVRTHKSDIENESIYRPRQITIAEDGTNGTLILGTARINTIEKRDAGGVRIRWLWSKSRDGAQPTQFVVSKVSGSGTIQSVVVAVTTERQYEAILTGLTDGVSYVFKLSAQNGSVENDLVTGIEFVGDAAGPPAVSGLTVKAK